MARIREQQLSTACLAGSESGGFLEIALARGEDAADFAVAFYEAGGAVVLVIDLTDPRVSTRIDAGATEVSCILSTARLPLLTGDTGGSPDGSYAAVALVNRAEPEVIAFQGIADGDDGILALNGPAAGAVSQVAPADDPSCRAFSNRSGRGAASLTPAGPGSGFMCFTAGTLITTPMGERPVEQLAAEDLVLTLDSGARPIRWVGERRVLAQGDMAPVHFAAGALGPGRELLVSQQHRMLVNSPELELLAGTQEALVAARHLVNGTDVTLRPGGWMRYIHFMFDRHELVWANGVPAESYLVAETTAGSMTPAMRAEFETLFPDLVSGLAAFEGPARPVLDGWEVQAFKPSAAAAA